MAIDAFCVEVILEKKKPGDAELVGVPVLSGTLYQR